MPEEVLAKGSIFDIVARDGVVRCSVVNRDDVTPEEGARCAREMHEVLTRDVLTPRSPYRGLIFDVRRGPAAFGPKTRAALEKLFRTAEQAKLPIVARVGDSAVQRLQFTALCKECAPGYARTVTDDTGEGWARQGGPSR